jgi:hypothetical protein
MMIRPEWPTSDGVSAAMRGAGRRRSNSGFLWRDDCGRTTQLPKRR